MNIICNDCDRKATRLTTFLRDPERSFPMCDEHALPPSWAINAGLNVQTVSVPLAENE